MAIGVVVGMAAEAVRAAAPSAALPAAERPLLFVSGARPGRAYEGAKALLAQGAEALLSFGLAGGLDAALATGDAVLADFIVLPDARRLATSAAWRSSLAAALSAGARVGAIAGRDEAAATAAAKAALARSSGALAVDMESHGVARAAHEAGIPFMALRVILDPAGSVLPSAALAGLAPDGTSRVVAVLGRLLLRPQELPQLLALARDHRRALAVLGRLAADLGPAFGFLV